MSSTYVAPSYGVSGGPAISPRNSVKLSFFSSSFIWHFATCQYQHTKLFTRGVVTALKLARAEQVRWPERSKPCDPTNPVLH